MPNEVFAECICHITPYLDALQGWGSHIEEDTIQHRHRNELSRKRYSSNLSQVMLWLKFMCQPEGGSTHLKGTSHEYRASHKQEDDQASEPLLSDAQKTRLLSWSRAFRLQLQTVHVSDGQDSCGDKPRQTHDGAHGQHYPHHQEVQVVPATFLGNKLKSNVLEIFGSILNFRVSKLTSITSQELS